MRLSLGNFGPIKKATLETKPLTIIIGKNNLGKSFLAQLIHSSLSLGPIAEPLRLTRFRGRYLFRYPFAIFPRRVPYSPGVIKHAIKESPTESEAVDRIIKIVTQAFRYGLSQTFNSLLEQNFGTKTKQLININFSNSHVKLAFNPNASITFSMSKRKELSADLDFNKETLLQKILSDNDVRRILRKKRIAFADCVHIQEFVLGTLSEFVLTGNQGDEPSTPDTVFYVPAGRAGLLESYDTVVSALVSLSPVAPIRGISMPPLPGMASQFYNTIMELRGKKGPLSTSARKFTELLGGEIELTRLREPVGKAMISYVFRSNRKKRSVDIIHAASMIKELTPLYLIIRELVSPEDFLIIEEPESHLHPGAQLQLVEIFADLVNQGVKIIMTTHSDLILRKVSQLTGRYRLKESRKGVSLDVKNVAIYWLKEERKGSVSRQIHIGKYGSLEEIPSFDEAIKELYQEEVSLQSRLQLEE